MKRAHSLASGSSGRMPLLQPLLLVVLCTSFAGLSIADTEYWWIGEDGNISDASNWSDSESGTAGLSSVTINSAAKLHFPKAVTITLDADRDVGYTYFTADVTFTASTAKRLNLTRTVDGAGKTITLAGKAYFRAASRDIEIKPNLCISGDENRINWKNTTVSDGYTVTVSGALTGTGTLYCYGTTAFTGDTTGFSGTIVVPYDESAISTAKTWTLGTGGSVKLQSGTVAIDHDNPVEVPFPFASGQTVTLATASHKAGDTLFTCASGSASDWSGVKFTINSPNTGAASLFYGTPAFEDKDGKVLVKAAYKSEKVYVWNGEEGAELGTAANWTGTATVDSTWRNNVFVIENGATAKMTSSSSTKEMGSILFLGDATITLNTTLTVYSTRVWEGPGKVTIAGANTLRGNSKGDWRVYNNVGITENKTLKAQGGSATDVHTIHFYGKVESSAEVTLADDSSKAGAVVFHGDMSGVTGTIKANWQNCDASYIQFADDATNAASAKIEIGSTGNTSNLCATAGTYTFGALSGKVTGGTEEVTIVTKGTDEKSIAYTAGTGAWTLENAGSATVTVTGANFSGYTVSGTGSFTLPALNGASVTKVGTKANANSPAVVAGASADLTGLSLTLMVADDLPKGWQYLVEAASFAADAPATAYASNVTLPTGRKFQLTMASSTILAAQEASGLAIVVR